MFEHTPCGETSAVVHLAIVAMNAIQSVLVAFIAARAVRKNREDRSRERRGPKQTHSR